MNVLQARDEIKNTEKPLEWWTTIFIYKLSTPLVYLLRDTRVSANQLTFFSLAVVIIASFLIALAGSLGLITASIFLQVGFILDNADGQLARYRKSASNFGHWLDSTCDRLCELFIISSMSYRFSQVNDKALFFGFYCLFLIYYYHGKELKALPFTENGDKKKKIEAKEGRFLKKITFLRHKLKWIPFNTGEQYFLFSIFLLLNRVDLFFFFFSSYGTMVTVAFPLYKYYHYRLSLGRRH